MTILILQDVQVRAPLLDDLQTVLDLSIACDIDEYGEPESTAIDQLVQWQRLHFDLATNAWLILSPDGQCIGYGDVWNDGTKVRLAPNTCVHPNYRGRGIGTWLLRRAEIWARENVLHAEGRAAVKLQTFINGRNPVTRQLFEQEGYSVVRHTWRMEIFLDAPPPAPQLPAGVAVRTILPDVDERAVHAVVEDAFKDLWGHVYTPFETWRQWMIQRNDFDPSLWFLAIEDAVIAGVALCYDYGNSGWVRQLAVRRPWRHRGIGLALLHHAFGEFYRRDRKRIGLAVDSQSLTGATRLYERAGMHVTAQYDGYEKEIHTDGA